MSRPDLIILIQLHISRWRELTWDGWIGELSDSRWELLFSVEDIENFLVASGTEVDQLPMLSSMPPNLHSRLDPISHLLQTELVVLKRFDKARSATKTSRQFIIYEHYILWIIGVSPFNFYNSVTN